MILLVCSHPEFSPGSGQVRNLSLSVLQTIWMPRQRCKTSDTCSECAWLLQGSVWRRKFPWLWAGYAGKTTTLTVGCTDCALHAAKFNAAASRFPLMPPSVQPDRRPGDFGIEMGATQNRAWANCCFGSSKAASAMKKCLKGSINSSSCLKEDNLNLETSFPHGEKLVRTRNVRFPCHEELSAK